jgi:hypothetical protein
VVKDDAIPPGGRQVRCASCKHSWHQEPEGAVVEAESVAVDFEAPAPAEGTEEVLAEAPAQAIEEGMIAGEPQPEVAERYQPEWTSPSSDEPIEPAAADEVSMEEAPAVADEWRRPEPAMEAPPPEAEPTPDVEEPLVAAEEEFVGYAPIADEEAPRRRWPLILAILVLIAAAAAAFWFLAPPEWKERAGIAQAGATPLQLMITNSDRQPYNPGNNELVAISGRVINPTDREQIVPPIRAELRNKQTRAVVHRWTIAPPARVLAPRSSASFNSAEIDVPKGGDELTITLGQVGS